MSYPLGRRRAKKTPKAVQVSLPSLLSVEGRVKIWSSRVNADNKTVARAVSRDLLLVEHGVQLSTTSTTYPSRSRWQPLLSDVSMFEYLIEQYRDRLPAEAGRVEVFDTLLEFEHDKETIDRYLGSVCTHEFRCQVG
ncbi:hypothetical protein GGR56DRAFT_83835 [Xylariaceae sp. FL0804]|nr:hypothetical protein GGR56DRAFT_83835 [Xylariaceae sp. FL0804]